MNTDKMIVEAMCVATALGVIGFMGLIAVAYYVAVGICN